jgi:3',5'-cyclic AMP phosphodiesterase CpdA
MTIIHSSASVFLYRNHLDYYMLFNRNDFNFAKPSNIASLLFASLIFAYGGIDGILMIAFGHEDTEGHTQENTLPVAVPDKVAYAPTGIPDRIVLSWTADPATTQAVTWRTSGTVGTALAEIAVADEGPFFVTEAKSFTAETTSLTTYLGLANYHTVEFTGLAPKTMYVYRVGDGVNWSEWSHFKTASLDPDPFTFLYVGDAQNQLKEHWSRVIRESFRSAPYAAFVIHAGDLVNGGNLDGEWGEWFYATSHIHRSIPCIATPGNHEYRYSNANGEKSKIKLLTSHWRPTFAFPTNGPGGMYERVYWIDYQGVRIISLDSNRYQKEQVPWLEEVLEHNPNRWTVVTCHHPIYSSKTGRDNLELRNLWQPIFDKYRVDIVLQGHEHTYARTKLMTHEDADIDFETNDIEENVSTGVTAQSKVGGTVYVVSVSGPKMYELGRKPYMRRAAEETQLYQVIHVDGSELNYEARTATGRLYDSFTLKKRTDKPNELIDYIPSSPERIRPSVIAE